METRLHGGPGAGKTTALAARIAAAAERTDRLLAVSLTRTAATRLVYEGLPLDREQVGTLHSVCYRALGRPELVERHIAEWNQEHYGYRLTVPRVDFEGGGDAPAGGKATHADGLRARYDLARARMTTSVWPGVADFARTWEAWKKAKGYDDFTDLIAKAPPTAPGDPVAIYVDEAQDHSPLELDLLRRWGRAAGELTLAGDADQSIYDWRGADAHAFLDPRIAAEDVVLPQSYRVPRTVHAAARVLMYNVRDRAPATAAPRDADGRAGWYDHTWKYAEAVPWALRDRPEGSVMLLASCAYMLAPAAAVMQQRGIPFHNPYRPLEGRWNPLGTRATTAVAAFLRPRADVWGAEARAWTVADMAKWAAVLRPEFLHHPGAQVDLKSRRGKDAQAPAVPEEWLSAAALEELTPADPFALWRAATRADQARLRYPLDVVVKSGPEALRARPRVVLGTIHCSPPDEPVLTDAGWVPIGDLDPGRHRLGAYELKTNQATWGGRSGAGRTASPRGYPFTIAARPYDGDLVVLQTEVSRTRVTPEHRVLARFTDAFFEKWVVYLMRRGGWWRVGICVSGHRPYIAGSVAGRLASEQADDGWILAVTATRREALVEEARIQATYGIPGLTFESSKQRLLSRVDLHAVHDAAQTAVGTRVGALLRDYGLLADMPLYSRNTPKKNMRSTFTTAAANIIPGYMALPVIPPAFADVACGRQRLVYALAAVTRERYTGPVYGLDVPPYHHYISGGAAVHNSVKGAEADTVIVFPDLSPAASRSYHTRDGHDSVHRQMYVGLTRTRQTLLRGRAVSMRRVSL